MAPKDAVKARLFSAASRWGQDTQKLAVVVSEVSREFPDLKMEEPLPELGKDPAAHFQWAIDAVDKVLRPAASRLSVFDEAIEYYSFKKSRMSTGKDVAIKKS